jgi:betaine-homocysteine S-methyltransferase
MAPAKDKKGLLERLSEGPVIGDGGFVFQLEKRGYIKAGPWTPECVVENPEAVRQLHREFLRAGSDVMQACTFYASEDKLTNRGNKAGEKIGVNAINEAASDLAIEVAAEGDALTLGGLCQCPSYLSGIGKAAVQAEFKKQTDVFVAKKLDFLLCEYFEHIEEMEWAIEVCVATGLPVCANMCIGPEGDMHGVSAGECAVRMAKAGAHVVGVNCHFDPFVSLEAIKLMKVGLEEAGLKPYLMCQPLAYHTPDAGVQGFIDLPEFPFGLEPRICTRWDMHRYAREAYDLGVRYIGGCCGFEPFHIRAVSEELAQERGKMPAGHEKHDMWGGGLKMHTKPWVRARARRDYWEKIQPASGRPCCPSMSKPDNWGFTQGDKELVQQTEATSLDQIQTVVKIQEEKRA